ncbi:AI-2E family transporter [Marinovum sp.]|uniref:AI-2E family transporter n=1 Tax=Marinovum sp. TaxID=2024839 RepID=UPI002B2679E1|nr:AI-2E family transporter [Marinovum sp.]
MAHRYKNPDPILRSAVIVIAAILVFASLKAGADIFAPLALATITGVMLAPVTDGLEKLGLTSGLASALVLLAGMCGIGVLILLIEPVVWRVAEEIPRIRLELRGFIEDMRGLIRGLEDVNREVEQALGGDGTSKPEGDAETVVPSLTSAILLAPVFLAQFLIFFGALFFFLFTRKNIYIYMSRRIGSSADTREIMRRFTRAERVVSRYFLTISVINFGMGAALGGALMVIGLPGPVLWGLAAAMLNYILYIGPIAMTIGLSLAGLLAFDGVMVIVPPAIYLFFNLAEAQFVTPSLVGKNIAINPLLIFVSLVVWLWLWGPIGAIVAIPMLAILLVMLDVFEGEVPGEGAASPPPVAEVAPAPAAK